MAPSILPPDDAAGTEDRQGGDGATTIGMSVLDAAPKNGIISSGPSSVRTRGSRKSPWCAVNHRDNEWATPLLFSEEFELVIMMIAIATEEMHGSGRILTRED